MCCISRHRAEAHERLAGDIKPDLPVMVVVYGGEERRRRA
jgi:hypothetical protein